MHAHSDHPRVVPGPPILSCLVLVIVRLTNGCGSLASLAPSNPHITIHVYIWQQIIVWHIGPSQLRCVGRDGLACQTTQVIVDRCVIL